LLPLRLLLFVYETPFPSSSLSSSRPRRLGLQAIALALQS
jgi:hypothetical protein